MDKSEKLRKIILTKYKSLKEFANEVNIPSTTLISALDRGIGGMGIDRVIKICDTLKIDIKTFEPIKETYNPYKLELNKEEYLKNEFNNFWQGILGEKQDFFSKISEQSFIY